MEIQAKREADPLEFIWWNNYIQSTQLNGVSDKDLFLAMREALSGPSLMVIPRIISEVKQARRIFKEIYREKGVFNIRLFQMLLEQRQEYDLAYNLAVSHGLWDLALRLQDAIGVLPKSKRKALKEAIKVQAWEAVYRMVSTNTASSMVCRNTFLTLIRNCHFQAALQMLTRGLYLPSVGDVKFAFRISFEVGDCSSSFVLLVERCLINKTSAKHLVKCYIQGLKKMIHNESHGQCLPMQDTENSRQNEMIIWQFINPPNMFLSHFIETESTDFLAPIFKYFLKQSVDWRNIQLYCRLCTVCYINDALVRYAVRIAIAIPEFLVASLDILADEMLKSRLLTLSLKLAVRSRKGEFLILAARHKSLLQLMDLCPILAAHYRSPDKWPLAVPAMEELMKRLSSTEMPPLEFRTFISQHLKERRKLISLIKWCTLNSCYHLAASLSAVINQNKLFFVNLRKLGTSFPSVYDNTIFEIVKKKSVAWKDTRNWAIVVPVVEKRLQSFQCGYDLWSAANAIKDSTNDHQRLKLLKWAAGHSFFSFGFLLALVNDDFKRAAKFIVHLNKLSEIWYYFVPNLNMDFCAWQHRSLWRLLAPVTEIQMSYFEEQDEIEMFLEFFTVFNNTFLKEISTWCYKNSFYQLCLLLTVLAHDHKMLMKVLDKIEDTIEDTWNIIKTKTVSKPSLWEKPSYMKMFIPILEHLIKNPNEREDHKFVIKDIKQGISPSAVKRYSQWSYKNSYFHFHLALAIISKNCCMILKSLRNLSSKPHSSWLKVIFKTTMNASTWKVMTNWDLLVPVLEQTILVVNYSKELESMFSRLKKALGIYLMELLCKWCIGKCFHLTSVLLLRTSSEKNWQLMQEMMTKVEGRLPFPVLSYLATAALEYKSYELTMTFVCQMDLEYSIQHFLQYAITSSQDIEVGSLINFCKTKGMQDWVVKLSVLSDQWNAVDQEIDLSTMTTRNFAMNKACKANQWTFVCNWLQRDTWEDSVLVDVLQAAMSAGECACATLVFGKMNPLTVNSSCATTLFSGALQLSGDKRNKMLIMCIKNGLAGAMQTTDDIYRSPLFQALHLDVSLQFPVVKALFEAGACTVRSLVKAKRHNLGHRYSLHCSPHVKQFAEHVSSMPRSLQSLCRLSISHRIGCAGRQGRIHSLPLPNNLKDYLMFSDLEQELCDS